MAESRFLPEFRYSAFEKYYWLARPLNDFVKSSSVSYPFHVNSYNLRLLISLKKIYHFVILDIYLISHPYYFAESYARMVRHHVIHHQSEKQACLGDYAYISRFYLRYYCERCNQAVVGIEYARRIRAENPYSAFFSYPYNLSFVSLSYFSLLAKSGAYDYNAFNTFFRTIPHHFWNYICRNSYYSKIYRIFYSRYIRIAFYSENFLSVRVN